MRSDTTLIYYKREILSKISKVMFLLIIPMGFYRFYEGNFLQGISDMVFGSYLLYTSFIVRNIDTDAFFRLARKVFFLAFVTLFILMIHTHETIVLFIWFTTAMYLVFYVFDNNEGWRWFVYITLITISLFVYDPSILGLKGYELIVMIFNMFAVILIITWYERIKSEAAQSLLDNQYMLEVKVKEKTQELNALNENLERRIAEEVEKNRIKERQLIQQSRLAQMGEIIGMIAHQWRQPLSAISTQSAILEMKVKHQDLDPETILKKAQDISALSQKLSRTIDDFRDFFNISKEKVETDYDEIIQSVRSIFESSFPQKHIILDESYACHDRFVTYKNRVKQALLNIMKNAEDALVEKGVADPYVRLATYRRGEECILEISDNAGGIPKEIMEKIFDPYFSTKNERDGTGLGLYMSKVMIENHCGGKLEAENSEEGAIFRIILKVNTPQR